SCYAIAGDSRVTSRSGHGLSRPVRRKRSSAPLRSTTPRWRADATRMRRRRMHIQFGAPDQPTLYLPITPKTVAERVADWRERHPDRVAAYNAKRRAQRQAAKAACDALRAERFAARQAELAAKKAA